MSDRSIVALAKVQIAPPPSVAALSVSAWIVANWPMVRGVRFDFTHPEDAPLDPFIRSIVSGKLDRNQPYAVVHDFSVVPLQVLHCCFDPKMRSWQEVTVPACSFLPSRRMAVLNTFRAALVDGLILWGVQLHRTPVISKNVSLLLSPEKSREASASSDSSPQMMLPLSQRTMPAGPRITLIVSIAPDRLSAEDAGQIRNAAEALASAVGSSYLQHVTREVDALAYVQHILIDPTSAMLREKNAAVVFVVAERLTRAIHWLEGECLRRGVMPHNVRGMDRCTDRRIKHMINHVRANLSTRFTTDITRGYNIGKEVPGLHGRSALIVGVDACHTHDITTGAVVGLLVSPHGPSGNRLIAQFWRNDIRGKEVEQVAQHFGNVCEASVRFNGGHPVDEVVVFQDGNVFSELEAMRDRIPSPSALSFLCLHKRTHIRFMHTNGGAAAAAGFGGDGSGSCGVKYNTTTVTASSVAAGNGLGGGRGGVVTNGNVVKGSVVHDLTPMMYDNETDDIPSFYLQNHECFTSTARTVQYKVYCQSPTLTLPHLQKLSYTLAHVASPIPTKLPLPTRCAHRLSSYAERLFDANPKFKAHMIPEPLASRCCYL